MPKPVYTLDQVVAALDRTNKAWPAGAPVHYAFLSSLPASYAAEADQKGFLTFSDIESQFARNAFANIADVANVSFVEDAPTDQAGTDSGRITFGASNTMPSYAWGYTSTDYQYSVPRNTIDGADIWLNQTAVNVRQWVYSGYNFKALTHEIMHALGVSHPADYNADGSDITYATDATFYQDSAQYTVMSYFDASETGANFVGSDGLIHSAATLLIDDIAAIQALYGANMSTRTGDSTYGFHSNAGAAYDCTQNAYPIWCVWDAGGTDTLDFSGFSAAQTINLTSGAFSDVGGMIGNVSIAYGAVVENAVGGSGADRLVGNDAANVLTGGQGADTLTGGAGADTFRDTLADHYGDTIVDFSAGDKIAYSDIGWEGFAYQRLGASLSAGAGAITLTGNPVGHLVVGADAAGGVDLTLGAHEAGLNDFNADGHSDLLWRNTDSGVFTTWQVRGNVTGNSPQRNAYVDGSVDNGWQIQGTMDFNGDGGSDLVWRNVQTGVFTIWDATGSGTFTANAYYNGGVDLGWSMAGFADFNGDGRDDILWRNSGGQFTEWQSTGSGFVGNVYVDSTVDNSWKIVGLGDFNGDGRADILWRNTGGAFTEWSSTGNGFTPNTYVDGSMGPSWHIAAVGDFNGDGKDDLLWRHDNGAFWEWQSTGSGFNPVYFDTSVGLDWKIQGVFDFNDDGRADIVWRNDGGTLTMWQSTGNGFTANTLVDGTVGTDWQLISHHYDFV